jgi:hypothetical protein
MREVFIFLQQKGDVYEKDYVSVSCGAHRRGVGAFVPRPREQATYRVLYAAYRRLCDRFALGGDDTMQLLADLRRNAKKD